MIARIAAWLLLVSVAVLLLIAGWPQLLGLQYAPLVAQVVSLRAVAAVAALVLAMVVVLFAIGIRRFRVVGGVLVAMLLVFSIANGGVLAGRGLGSSEPADARGDDDLTVLAWNTLGDEPGAQAIADLALEVGADIVSLPETTEETAIEVAVIMRGAGRPMYVNHLALDDVARARTTSLLTSADLGTYSRDDTRGTTEVVPTVIAVPDSGTGPTIIAAHPVAPIPGYLDQWRRGLEWLSTVCVGDDVIMAGDLNSTLDHYADLGNGRGGTIGDCVDAAGQADAAAVGTWPASFPALVGAPIDHVMTTPNRRAAEVRIIRDRDDAGSDHRPIVARLIPSG